MKKLSSGIVAFCIVLCALFVTLSVGVLSYRVVFGADFSSADETTIAANKKRVANFPKAALDPRPFVPRVRNNDAPQPVMVLADDDLQEVLRELGIGNDRAKKIVEENQPIEADIDSKDGGEADQVAERLEDNRFDNDRNNDDGLEKDLIGDTSENPFYKYNDLQKNQIWWEMARASVKPDEVAPTYVLTTMIARKLGSRYSASVVDVFQFFKDGAQASWRTPTDPLRPE